MPLPQDISRPSPIDRHQFPSSHAPLYTHSRYRMSDKRKTKRNEKKLWAKSAASLQDSHWPGPNPNRAVRPNVHPRTHGHGLSMELRIRMAALTFADSLSHTRSPSYLCTYRMYRRNGKGGGKFYIRIERRILSNNKRKCSK